LKTQGHSLCKSLEAGAPLQRSRFDTSLQISLKKKNNQPGSNRANKETIKMSENDFAQLWASTPAAEKKSGGYEEAPDGKYLVEIERCELKKTQDSGKSYINWGLKILEGNYTGKFLWKKSFLQPSSIPFLKKDLDLLGACPPRYEDLNLDLMIGIRVAVTKKTKDSGYSDVYFNSVVASEDIVI